MAQDLDNYRDPSQRRVIISAVILAVIVVGALWFVLFNTPSTTNAPKASAGPSSIALTSITPTFLPEFSEPVNPQNNVTQTSEPSVLPDQENTPVTSPQAVPPTSPTGPENWIIPLAVAAMLIGGVATYRAVA